MNAVPMTYTDSDIYGKVMPRPCTECTGRGPHTPGAGQHQYSPSRFLDHQVCFVVGFLTCDREARYLMLWFALGEWHQEEVTEKLARKLDLSLIRL